MEKESRYWGYLSNKDIEEGRVPDLQVPFRKLNPQNLWDDTEVDYFVRGKYVCRLLDACGIKRGAKCLELCCGTGTLSLEAARRGADVTGIDISSGSILVGQRYQEKFCKAISGKINLFVGDLNKIELPTKKFDSVYVWDGLHHISDMDHLAFQVSKTLKENGIFVVHDHALCKSILKNKVAWFITEVFFVILPTYENFHQKIKQISNQRIKKPSVERQLEEQSLFSPFEDISGENIIKSIKNQFRTVELERYSSLTHRLAARIRFDFKYRFGLIRFICFLDAFLIKFKILNPEYFFLKATKE